MTRLELVEKSEYYTLHQGHINDLFLVFIRKIVFLKHTEKNQRREEKAIQERKRETVVIQCQGGRMLNAGYLLNEYTQQLRATLSLLQAAAYVSTSKFCV